MKKLLSALTLLMVMFTAPLLAESIAGKDLATFRHGEKIATQTKTQPIAKPIVDDVKVARNYPMQPPIIPHNIRDYQVDLNVNKCLSCHSRKQVGESQATMISVTHYMDSDGNFLADVSPRRYFCGQCHVVQHDDKPIVGNEFIDIDKLLESKAKQ